MAQQQRKFSTKSKLINYLSSVAYPERAVTQT